MSTGIRMLMNRFQVHRYKLFTRLFTEDHSVAVSQTNIAHMALLCYNESDKSFFK